jgi:hypothetical protein
LTLHRDDGRGIIRLREDVASLQQLIGSEQSARAAADSVLEQALAREVKERSAEDDDLADDVREQLIVVYDTITSRVTAAVSSQLGLVTSAINDLSDYTGEA